MASPIEGYDKNRSNYEKYSEMLHACNKNFQIWPNSSILLRGITVPLQPKIKSATKNIILIASKDMKNKHESKSK